MVRRVILLVGEETSVFRSENIWAFYHRLLLDQGHVRCIFAAGWLRKGAGLGHCWIVGAGSVKEQGFTDSVSVDTDRGKWTVPAPLFSRKGREHEGWSSCLSWNIFFKSQITVLATLWQFFYRTDVSTWKQVFKTKWESLLKTRFPQNYSHDSKPLNLTGTSPMKSSFVFFLKENPASLELEWHILVEQRSHKWEKEFCQTCVTSLPPW